MALMLLVLCMQEPEYLLPQEITRVSGLVRTEQGLLLLDKQNETVWLLDGAGAKPVYLRQGSGPGEYRKLFKLRAMNHQLALCDLSSWKFIILDQQWQLVEEIKVPGFARDIWWDEHHRYLVYPTLNRGMVHQYKNGVATGISFGSLLDRRELAGFESGQILGRDGVVYFIHHFLPVLELYNLDGQLIRKLAIPGMENTHFVSKGSKLNISYSLVDMGQYQGKLYLKLVDYVDDRTWLYLFDPQKMQFEDRKSIPHFTLGDDSGSLYQLFSSKNEERFILRSFQLE